MKPGKSIDMLHGSLFKNIVAYAIPIILTNILQLLFNAADLMVVGNFCKSECVGAVGATSSLINLIINLFIGLSVGTGVSCAIAIGTGEGSAVHRVVHTALPVAITSGVLLTAVGVIFSKPLLVMMETPTEFLELSATYMRIYFLGITATMVYNFCAAILRAAGDTKSPFIFLLISGIINVILNLIFVTIFDMDVDGVALATIISQFLSAILTVWALMKRTDFCRLCLSKIRVYKKPLLEILRIGVPSGLQSCLFSFSNVLIQSSVNSLGPTVVTGSAAAANLEGFIWVSMNSMHQSALNFTGQNVGIKNYNRVSKIFKICILSSAVIGLVMGVLFYLFGETLLSFYITDSPEAIKAGMIRLLCISAPYLLAGIMDTATGSIRGMGVSLPPMLITVIGVCVFRVVWIFTIFKMPQFNNAESLYLSYPISWIITFLAELWLFIYIIKKRKNQNLNIETE